LEVKGVAEIEQVNLGHGKTSVITDQGIFDLLSTFLVVMRPPRVLTSCVNP